MDIEQGQPTGAQASVPMAMAQLIEEFDWSANPLGPRAGWPPELQTFVRYILESSFPAAIVWGEDLITIYNDAFRPILGNKPEALGRSFADIWHEAWDEIGPIARRAYAGSATYIEDYPLVIDRSGEPEQAWFTFCYSPLRLSDGSVGGMMDTVVETTATVQARADTVLVNQELGHRLKNTLALVQSIAMQTLRGIDPPEAIGAFTNRISALGKAHDVLLLQGWGSVPLEQVATQTLRPLDGLSQIAIDGPSVTIGSRATLTLSLVLHELATNATKYGALTHADGRIDLRWSVEDGDLHLHWQERDGPHVEEPGSSGFGSRLIERGFGSSSRVSRQFLPTGLKMEIIVPLQELAT